MSVSVCVCVCLCECVCVGGKVGLILSGETHKPQSKYLLLCCKSKMLAKADKKRVADWPYKDK